MKTIDEIKKEVAKECAEEHFEVIFEAEISVGDYEQARRLWNEVGDRYIKQFEICGNDEKLKYSITVYPELEGWYYGCVMH